MRIYRIGAIGGGSGHCIKSHLRPGLDSGCFALSAVYDTSATNAGLAAHVGGPDVVICASAWQLVRRRDVDVVLICSPDAAHPWQLLLAVLAGKHVLCEKPLAINRRGLWIVRLALYLAYQRGQYVTTCLPRHVEDPDYPYGWAVDNVEQLARAHGQLVHIGVDFSYHVPVAEWKYRRSLLADHFMHDGDIVRRLARLVQAGRPVYMRARRLRDRFNSYAVAGTVGSVTFVCQGTRMLEEEVFPEMLTLRFATATCNVDVKSGVVQITRHADGKLVDETIVRGVSTSKDYDHRSYGIMRALATMLGGGESYLSRADMRFVLRSVVSLSGWRGRYRERSGG